MSKTTIVCPVCQGESVEVGRVRADEPCQYCRKAEFLYEAMKIQFFRGIERFNANGCDLRYTLGRTDLRGQSENTLSWSFRVTGRGANLAWATIGPILSGLVEGRYWEGYFNHAGMAAPAFRRVRHGQEIEITVYFNRESWAS